MPPKKDSGPQLTEEEQEALELRMLEAEVAHQEVELKVKKACVVLIHIH